MDATTSPDPLYVQCHAVKDAHGLKEKSMDSQWIATRDDLPKNGQAVNFLVDQHEVSLEGTYEDGAFCSRWAKHDAARVRSWCPTPDPL